MKFLSILVLLAVSRFADASVTDKECQSGPIHDLIIVELGKYLKTYPNPAIQYIHMIYSRSEQPWKAGNPETLCCVYAIAEREPAYPSCEVKREICFHAEKLHITEDSSYRTNFCDDGYP